MAYYRPITIFCNIGLITNFLFKGNDGKVRDVILGYENVEDYFNDDKCLGAIVGPLANRTADACFEIDGKEYKLEVNDNDRNNLHTARLGSLQKRVWAARFSLPWIPCCWGPANWESPFTWTKMPLRRTV